jgi:hypothetical protein
MEVTGCQIRGIWWVWDDSHFVFHQKQTSACCCFRSAVRILDTNLAVTQCMPSSFVKTNWHVPQPIPTSSAMLWMVWRRSWWMSSWIGATISWVVQLMGLPVCSSSSTDMRLVLNQACHWNTCVQLKIWSPNACWVNVRISVVLHPSLEQNLMHTHCSFLWSIVQTTTGHVHNSKWTCVKTVHVHPATWNLAHWLTRHGSPIIHWCFALPQLL